MVSLGEELKREREFREISLREIAEATKINMRILEAIENDNYKILPGGIFNRNFIRAYAEFIGLDPEIAVRKYQVQFPQEIEEQIPPLAVSVIQASSPTFWGINKRLFFATLGAVLGGLLMVLLWLFRSKIPFLGLLSEFAHSLSQS